MSTRLFARVERLQPRKSRSYVVRYDPGDTEADIEAKVRDARGPIMLAPRGCYTSEEWLAKYAPRGAGHE